MARNRRIERQQQRAQLRKGWKRTQPSPVPGAELWQKGDWVVLLSVELHGSGHDMLHVSISNQHEHVWPTWPQLVDIKERFMGRQREAMQIIPPASEHVNAEHVNVVDNCFHLWARA